MAQSLPLKIGPLRTRETPPQARARQRAAEILNAAARLMCTHAISDISTTMIAEQASIPVSSVYRYFPTIDLIVDELYLQTTEEIDDHLFGILGDTDTYPEWRRRVGAVMDTMRRYFNEHAYYRKLLQEIFARTGGLALDRQKANSITQHLTEHWRAGGDNFSGADPAVTAQVTMQVFLAVEGILVSQASEEMADDYFEALKINLECYLANFLSD